MLIVKYEEIIAAAVGLAKWRKWDFSVDDVNKSSAFSCSRSHHAAAVSVPRASRSFGVRRLPNFRSIIEDSWKQMYQMKT